MNYHGLSSDQCLAFFPPPIISPYCCSSSLYKCVSTIKIFSDYYRIPLPLLHPRLCFEEDGLGLNNEGYAPRNQVSRYSGRGRWHVVGPKTQPFSSQVKLAWTLWALIVAVKKEGANSKLRAYYTIDGHWDTALYWTVWLAMASFISKRVPSSFQPWFIFSSFPIFPCLY